MIYQMILLLAAVALFLISFFHFAERGPLLNNAYLFASEQERKTMDKKPHYRQSGIVFGLIGANFLLLALESFLETGWIYYIVWILAFIVVIYAIVSSIREGTKSNKR